MLREGDSGLEEEERRGGHETKKAVGKFSFSTACDNYII
jgi:hypothetical protein